MLEEELHVLVVGSELPEIRICHVFFFRFSMSDLADEPWEPVATTGSSRAATDNALQSCYKLYQAITWNTIQYNMQYHEKLSKVF